jgi:hypothetical protein
MLVAGAEAQTVAELALEGLVAVEMEHYLAQHQRMLTQTLAVAVVEQGGLET